MAIRILFSSALLALSACSSNNVDLSSATPDLEVVAFDRVLLQAVTASETPSEPIRVDNKQFIFPQDQSAFSELFP